MILDKNKRAVVTFDVQNALHRSYARHFITESKWGDLPIKFDTAGLSNLAAHVRTQMLNYYVEKEITATESATKSS